MSPFGAKRRITASRQFGRNWAKRTCRERWQRVDPTKMTDAVEKVLVSAGEP